MSPLGTPHGRDHTEKGKWELTMVETSRREEQGAEIDQGFTRISFAVEEKVKYARRLGSKMQKNQTSTVLKAGEVFLIIGPKKQKKSNVEKIGKGNIQQKEMMSKKQKTAKTAGNKPRYGSKKC